MQKILGFLIQRLKKIQAAIFSQNSRFDLKIVRNSIFAHKEREFKDASLKKYFKAKSWYKVNPNYSDTLLSKEESDLAERILAYKNGIQKLSHRDLGYIEDLKNVYKEYHTDKVSTRVMKDDITGEGYTEEMVVNVAMKDNEATLTYFIIHEKDTLYRKAASLFFDPESYMDSLYYLPLFRECIYPYFNLDKRFTDPAITRHNFSR